MAQLRGGSRPNNYSTVCKQWVRLRQGLSFYPPVLLLLYHNLRKQSTLEIGVRRESNLGNLHGWGGGVVWVIVLYKLIAGSGYSLSVSTKEIRGIDDRFSAD